MNRAERRRQERLAKKGAGRAPVSSEAAIEGLQAQASEQYRAGRKKEALATCRRLISVAGDRPDFHAFAGMISLEVDDVPGAIKLYRKAVELRPDYPEAHYNLGNAYKRAGRPAEATKAYETALDERPDLGPAWHNLGSLRQAEGDLAGARAAFAQAAITMPDSAETQRSFGIVLHKLGEVEEAERRFRKALEIQPDWTLGFSNLMNVLMADGRHEEALGLADRWLELEPWSTDATARKVICLVELGRLDDARFYLDFDRFVWTRDWQPPAGFASIEAFNEALVEHVMGHKTLRVPPEDAPTYHHPKLHITDELLAGKRGPMGGLEAMIRQAIEAYRVDILANHPEHPLAQNWPEKWRLSTWATMLDGGGNLVPHIHIEGYIGGVYYPALPEVVDEADAAPAGWFELGRPPEEMRSDKEPLVRAVQPAEGRMILFPGYFYHRTVPFETPGRRISIAFDLVPDRE